MRPDGLPDVYVQESGQACDLAQLDAKIRALLRARSWLKKELELRKKAAK